MLTGAFSYLLEKSDERFILYLILTLYSFSIFYSDGSDHGLANPYERFEQLLNLVKLKHVRAV